MRVLVTYDVSTESREGRRRLRRVATICKDFGQRVQKSVFECSISQAKYEELRRRLVNEINEEEDSLRFYVLTEADYDRIEHVGIGVPIDFDGPLVI